MVQMAVLDSLSSSGDSEAVDPLDSGRVYTETDEPIETEIDDTTTVAQEARAQRLAQMETAFAALAGKEG